MPEFKRDTRALDRWLINAMDDEKTGFLMSFIDQAAMIQSNRHYRLTGTRSMVNAVAGLLSRSGNGDGLRKVIKASSISYYSSCFGSAIRLKRNDPVTASYVPESDAWEWRTPPVTSLFATDSTGFSPNNDYVYPVDYFGQPWSRLDYFKIVSMPSTLADTWGIGRSALYRCIQIARMTSAIYEHIFDLVSPDTAKGVLTVKGMSHTEFMQAVFGSEASNEQDALFKNGLGGNSDGGGGYTDAGDIIVLADRDDDINVKFVTLSRLPDNFYLDQWVRWTLTAFAANLGFPLEEFIGMPSSSLLGQSGAEVEAGQQRGASKGGAEFISHFQEGLQQFVIPNAIDFRFGDRDEIAELNEFTIRQTKANIVTELFQATQLAIVDRNVEGQDSLFEARAKGSHIISPQEARRLLVEWDVLPDWALDSLDGSTPEELSLAAGSLYTESDADYSHGSSFRTRGNPSVSSSDQDRRSRDTRTMRAKVLRLREEAMSSPSVRELYRLAKSGLPDDDQIITRTSETDRATGVYFEHDLVLWDSLDDFTRVNVWQVSQNVSPDVSQEDVQVLTRDAQITAEIAAGVSDIVAKSARKERALDPAGHDGPDLGGMSSGYNIVYALTGKNITEIKRAIGRIERKGPGKHTSDNYHDLVSELYSVCQIGRAAVVSSLYGSPSSSVRDEWGQEFYGGWGGASGDNFSISSRGIYSATGRMLNACKSIANELLYPAAHDEGDHVEGVRDVALIDMDREPESFVGTGLYYDLFGISKEEVLEDSGGDAEEGAEGGAEEEVPEEVAGIIAESGAEGGLTGESRDASERRESIRKSAIRLVILAYNAGLFITGDELSARYKTWYISGKCPIHSGVFNTSPAEPATVGFDEMSAPDDVFGFWPGYTIYVDSEGDAQEGAVEEVQAHAVTCMCDIAITNHVVRDAGGAA